MQIFCYVITQQPLI